MAIQIEQNDAIIQYTATGGEPTFAYDFPIFRSTDLVVTRATDASSIPVTLVEGVDYSVTGVGEEDGGTIVLSVVAVALQVWTLFRAVPEERLANFQQKGDYRADTINQELDLLTMQTQQLRRDLGLAITRDASDISRNLVLPQGIPATEGLAISFDSNGDLVMAANILGAIVSAAMKPVVEAATLAAAAQNMKVAQTEAFDEMTGGKANTILPLAIVTGNVALDLKLRNMFSLAVDAAWQLDNPPVVYAGTWIIYCTNDSGGGFAPVFDTNYNVVSGTYDATADAVNILYLSGDGSEIDVFIFQRP